MMKFLLIPILMLTFEASALAGWFSHDNQREHQLEQQLHQEQHYNNDLTVIIVVLGVGCVVTFIAGTIAGSKTRRESNEN